MFSFLRFQPHNIVIASSHESAPIKITEFGIATEIPECGYIQSGRIGTPHFMAPEVVNRGNHGCKVDVWACGEILRVAACVITKRKCQKYAMQFSETSVL